ncbi:hypothetical protein EW026_g4873 [Hermanssonia centrifuga]|uniref:Uncharacterized protein n=1 Tax=Hermanssonia centrifuga TaxID=98765 RepID=A0A4S4KFW1_9APHY|nr:hypothetical protein EW026_g4873 [Hermanssonia centrifuga]
MPPKVEYTLTVNIDRTQLEILRREDYKLCLTKRTGFEPVDVIWQATNPLTKNIFRWTADYQVFGASSFTPGALVGVETDSIPVEFVVRDKNGVMQPATGTPDDSGVFFVRNEYSPTFIGINAAHDAGKSSPSYVTQRQSDTGSETRLAPREIVHLWFYPHATAGTMFVDRIPNNSLQIDMAANNDAEVEFTASGVWVILHRAEAIVPSKHHRDADKDTEIGREAALLDENDTVQGDS